jgi:cysteinyl-tRNA synthetase
LLDQGVPGEVIRFVLLMTHYRSPMDWTEKKREEAEQTLRHWGRLTADAEDRGWVDDEVIAALSDDLNMAGAIARLHALAKAIASNPQKDCHVEKAMLLGSARLMGLLTAPLAAAVGTAAQGRLQLCLDALAAARLARDWTRADALKAGLAAAGVKVMIGKDGIAHEVTPAFDPARLEGVV